MAAVKTRFVVGLAESQLTWLRLEAARLGVSIAEVLRRIVDAHREGVGKW